MGTYICMYNIILYTTQLRALWFDMVLGEGRGSPVLILIMDQVWRVDWFFERCQLLLGTANKSLSKAPDPTLLQ